MECTRETQTCLKARKPQRTSTLHAVNKTFKPENTRSQVVYYPVFFIRRRETAASNES